MPRKPNKLLRLLLPLGIFLILLPVPIAVLVNTTGGGKQQPDQTTPDQTTPGQTPADQTNQAADQASQPPTEQARSQEEAPATQPDKPTEQAQAEPPAAQPEQGPPPTQLAPGAFTVEGFPNDPLATDFDMLGDLQLGTASKMRVEFSHLGAGIKAIRLADELVDVQADREAKAGAVEPERHVLVQGQVAGRGAMLVPFCALGVEVNGNLVPMVIGPGEAPAWRQVSRETPGVFEAFLLDAEGNRAIRVERAYAVTPGGYDLRVRQRVQNLTDQPLDIRWRQFGPIELFADTGYGGDKRRMRFGYLFDAEADPTRKWVDATDYLWDRSRFRGKKAAENFPNAKVWPNDRSIERGYEMVWTAMTNRYFGAILHPIIDPAQPNADKVFRAVERIDYVPLPDTGDMVFALTSPAGRLAPGAALDYDMGLYAGPLSKEVIREDPMLDALGVPGVVVYNFGSMCAFCTFSWLTGPLLALLRFLHAITYDWALAIILLVVCVRSVLHPITRWSQLRMLVFGKQMQGMAPKQKAIQEKYKDDKQRLQQEMAKLWREEGISPAGFLGCLPMFLQSPVWIALYAMLYFTIDLRHEPAFFGVFQKLTGNAWSFLSDLAEPDHAIYFGANGPKIPLFGTISGINILPLLLGVVFYIQQKYLTPPTTAAMTPEQESQQKMMKVMMVVMFPLIMYAAPSGLALYFITNSTLGILESRWIRSHAEKSGRLEPGGLKKPPRQGGFMARLKALAEQQQRLQTERGTSPKRQPRMPKDSGPNPRRFKQR
jgi:YidC/Oxa1 family membrane protein insertase